MQMGMIGVGRMGGDMVRRLLKGGHDCVVYDHDYRAVAKLVNEGATGSGTLEEIMTKLAMPRVLWLMLPAALVDETISAVLPHLNEGDIVIDGGNSYYRDDIRRAGELLAKGIHYVDVGTSGGVWGLERGYCLMIGGEKDVVSRLNPLFTALSPGIDAAPRTFGREKGYEPAEYGYLHCGPSGAGHFVKMVHNGIEYGLMASYAEGFNILRHADAGREVRDADAETAPLREPDYYRYDFNLSDIAELWRRGSVISSWLLDLGAKALLDSHDLDGFQGLVSDSGEGRWTVIAAIDEGVPAQVLSAALYERFSSQGKADFADRFLSAMRTGFGGHKEKTA
jgi:6-phosphogluconate dehydrogenase